MQTSSGLSIQGQTFPKGLLKVSAEWQERAVKLDSERLCEWISQSPFFLADETELSLIQLSS